MPMTGREKLAYKLKNRYHVRRSIFTLAIPAIIGMAIFGYSIYSGFSPVPLIGASTTATFSSANQAAATQSARQTEFKALADQLGPGQNASSVTVTTAALALPPAIHNFDLVLTISLITALGPYSVDATLAGRKVRKYEQDFTDFL